MLDTFFAVTLTSLYRVTVEGGKPCVEKVALHGESKIGVGEKLIPEPMLSIGTQLWMFNPQGPAGEFQREFGCVEARQCGPHTSMIIGLFKEEEVARYCFEQRSFHLADPRWFLETREVLDEIGDDHPVFSISHHPEFRLIQY